MAFYRMPAFRTTAWHWSPGVTEAFNPEMEEFGEERLIATALRAGGSAHNIRQAAMQDVTEFAQGQFHDDASLMVVRITG